MSFKIVGELALSQAHYAGAFLPTSEFLEEQGLYKKIADFVHEGNVIIDVGCGDCRLIHHLKEKNPDTTIIGIDVNPMLLTIGNDMLIETSHNVNFHRGINIAKDPDTGKLTLISDIVVEDIPFSFEKGKINLLQEDFRFGEILRERLEKDVGLADVITYTMPGGFSPHMILEKGEKDYNSVRAGLELNQYVLALGLELLKNDGKMIWAVRAGAKDPETLKNMNLDGLNLPKFKPYYDVNRVEIVHIDEQEQRLDLPAYTIDKKEIHYTKDIRKMKHNFKIVILLIEMIKKVKL